jgi:hypothetical protein
VGHETTCVDAKRCTGRGAVCRWRWQPKGQQGETWCYLCGKGHGARAVESVPLTAAKDASTHGTREVEAPMDKGGGGGARIDRNHCVLTPTPAPERHTSVGPCTPHAHAGKTNNACYRDESAILEPVGSVGIEANDAAGYPTKNAEGGVAG